MAARRSARDDEVDRDLRQGPRQDRPGPARRPARSDRVYVEGLNIIKRHMRPQQVPGAQRAETVGGVDREGGSDPRLQRDADRPQGQEADARRHRPRGRQALPRRQALRTRSSTDHGHDSRTDTPRRSARSSWSASATRRSMQVPRIEKITLNMGVGEAKQDSKMLEAATEQLATIAGQKPNVRRARKSIAAFKLREGMPVGVSVTLRRRARLRVPRPAAVDRDPADPRLPRPEADARSTAAATTRSACASR